MDTEHDYALRQRDINWQDWKYTAFIDFFRYSKNIRRHNTLD